MFNSIYNNKKLGLIIDPNILKILKNSQERFIKKILENKERKEDKLDNINIEMIIDNSEIIKNNKIIKKEKIIMFLNLLYGFIAGYIIANKKIF